MSNEMTGRELAVNLNTLPRLFEFKVSVNRKVGPVAHKVAPPVFESKMVSVGELIGKEGGSVPSGLDSNKQIDVAAFMNEKLKPTLYTLDEVSVELNIALNELMYRIQMLQIESDGVVQGKQVYHLTNLLPWVLWDIFTVDQLAKLAGKDSRSIEKKIANVSPVGEQTVGNRTIKGYWLHQTISLI